MGSLPPLPPQVQVPKCGDEKGRERNKPATQGRAHEHASPRIGIAVPSQWPRVAEPAARNISIEVEERNGEIFKE